ncbi:hypothetical protein [Kribbella sp. CA-293567]|uniref:hypothetical protein n=1 Tax=Kribbella sp. CA-293567 TaxID=3002436 RepID=UPI0022DDBF43|nr:hypothetical protein [Kribbella sp. CA-293567]WBQ03817.1 hypothetical protein OX958_28085 [Kribbella sp. CA-293567]
MTTIPTGPEHINREARVLEDVRARNDGHTQYEAGEIVRVMDVRPAPSFGGTPNQSVGFRRVTIAGEPGRRAAATSANNLELVPTEAERASALAALGIPASRPGVTVAYGNGGGGGGGGFSSWRHVGTATEGALFAWGGAGGTSATSRTPERRNAKEMDHAHTRVAAAYRELTNALDALKSLEARP